jgi:hypothetical protein
MIDEVIKAESEPNPTAAPVPRVKPKREIFRFNGDRPTAINLEHVTLMFIEGKKITFQFSSTATFIELADDAAANSVFDALLSAWAGEA